MGAADAGRGTGLLNSSRGGTYDGRGAPFAFAGGMYFLFALPTSGLRASSSRRSWRSYRIDERVCSTSAAVTSSVTSFLCRSRARCKFWEMPSARFAKIISYLLAYERVVSKVDQLGSTPRAHLFHLLQSFVDPLRPDVAARLEAFQVPTL